MKTFKQFVEMYVPTKEDDCKWHKQTNTYDGIDYHRHSLAVKTPTGSKLKIRISTSSDKDNKLIPRHTFDFAVNNSMTAEEQPHDLSGADQLFIKHHITRAFNHYVQHKLPSGHSIVGTPFGNSPKEKAQKNKLYGATMKAYASKDPNVTYSSKRNEFFNTTDHILTKK